jgi:Protein of unknown function (DUF2924)
VSWQEDKALKQSAITKLCKLGTAGRAELLAMWTATTGKPPQFRASRELLASALAWHLQERKFGGLKPATKRKLRLLARTQERKSTARSMAPRATNFRPGTVIIKQWRGAQHTVVVLADGFQHQGKVYASLSRLAREITGTRWNGPAFFGLRKRHGGAAEVRNHGR